MPYLKSCLCTVVPSEWYDNFPNVILESFAYKKAVVATNFGSLPELVRNGETGLTFNYQDVEDFRSKIAIFLPIRRKQRQWVKMPSKTYRLVFLRQSTIIV